MSGAKDLLNKLRTVEQNAAADQSASEVLASLLPVDGTGSDLDADTVDGIQGASLLRSDTADSATGKITFDGGIEVTGSAWNTGLVKITGTSPNIEFNETDSGNWQVGANGGHFYILPDTDSNGVYDSIPHTFKSTGDVTHTGTVQSTAHNIVDSGTSLTRGSNNSLRVTTANGYIEHGAMNTLYAHIYTDRPSFYFNKDLLVNGNTVWHSGNDGAGSGLDADLLEGYHATTAPTGATIALRDSSADIQARLFRSNYPEQTSAPASAADICFRNSTTDNYMRFMTRDAARSYLGIASAISDAGKSLASNGYMKLSSGFIIQWGATATNVTSVTFPLAFPTACLQVVLTPQYNVAAPINGSLWYVSGQSVNSFSITAGHASVHHHWIAIGY